MMSQEKLEATVSIIIMSIKVFMELDAIILTLVVNVSFRDIIIVGSSCHGCVNSYFLAWLCYPGKNY